ncbi:hypothetical protein SULAZ_0831 [Sulfurihydrogenibium azorense Az-Fu1]|uniref:Uncharacterized protein n=1 Tax=Sulfurihydrogenibium azorense (strain DSM 15241 / OCM 825 / Az-Fu1) TaxID=204536 RepID=C1DUM3_SULAA|nr:hypothetical protein SULAZ_0831 [Sulfurihydrogenibium azorense Az-Fu1]
MGLQAGIKADFISHIVQTKLGTISDIVYKSEIFISHIVQTKPEFC